MAHYLDLPRHGILEGGVPILSGWYAGENEFPKSRVKLTVDGDEIPYKVTERPDVEALFGGHTSFGFTAVLDSKYWTCAELKLDLAVDGRPLASMDVRITPEAAARMNATAERRADKRQWCLEHARCPRCFSRDLRQADRNLHCENCGTNYPQESQALNLMKPESFLAFNPLHAASTSANEYDFTARGIIESVTREGGMLLDCGAGMRPELNDHVVNLEIGDYPSTDLLAVGDALPFQDCVFDGVLSVNVLEHVSNPFACSRELVRVLKPGGQLYVVVPFLQPEHGYPSHYFNMTRQGLRQLFTDLAVESQGVPELGKPILGLHWMVQLYSAHLRPGAREEFLDMTMRQLIEKLAVDYLDQPMCTELSEKGNWTLACATSIVLRK